VPIYFIQYEARPNPESEDFVKCGGGFVNCWVKSNTPHEAKEVSTKTINENNWQIVAVEADCREVSESSYSEEDEGLEHYEQATLDGECYVFHTWRNEPQEDNERH
jgi:hypothetical protein